MNAPAHIVAGIEQPLSPEVVDFVMSETRAPGFDRLAADDLMADGVQALVVRDGGVLVCVAAYQGAVDDGKPVLDVIALRAVSRKPGVWLVPVVRALEAVAEKVEARALSANVFRPAMVKGLLAMGWQHVAGPRMVKVLHDGQ